MFRKTSMNDVIYKIHMWNLMMLLDLGTGERWTWSEDEREAYQRFLRSMGKMGHVTDTSGVVGINRLVNDNREQ